jgi:hypothetical protein
MTVVAQYSRGIYTVTFDLRNQGTRIGGGGLVQTVAGGQAAIAPAIQVEEGWVFEGWNTSSFSKVTRDLTVTARYSKATYDISFDLGAYGNRTGGGALDQTVIHGQAAVAPTVEAIADWLFIGWDMEFDNITSELVVEARYMPTFVRFEPRAAFLEAPSYVNAVFSLSDRAGNGVNLPVEIFDRSTGPFVVTEEGRPISAFESFADIEKLDEVPSRVNTVLLLDTSVSLRREFPQIQEAAKALVDQIFENQFMAVCRFSSSAPKLVQGFTQDKDDLKAAIDAMSFDLTSSTNLVGSAYDLLLSPDDEGLDPPDGLDSARWSETFSLSGIETGFLVVFTDGSDFSGLRTDSELFALREAESKAVFTVGLGDEPDPEFMEAFGNAGSYNGLAIEELEDTFLDIQQRIFNTANSFYWLNYASPRRVDGENTLSLAFNGNQNPGPDNTLNTTFNSGGFSDVLGGVYINRRVFRDNGVSEVTIAVDQTETVDATTILGFPDEEPEYEWILLNPGLATITPVADTNQAQVVIRGEQPGSTILTINDTVNGELFTRTIILNVVNSSGPAGLVDYLASFDVPQEVRGPKQDPDGDGIDNLMEFALGSDPTEAGTPYSSFSVGAGGLQYSYSQEHSDLFHYTVEISTDLSDPGAWTSEGVDQGTPDGSGNVVATVGALSDSGFIRLRVTER